MNTRVLPVLVCLVCTTCTTYSAAMFDSKLARPNYIVSR